MGRIMPFRGNRRAMNTLFSMHPDPRDLPMYPVREAAEYVGVPRGTLRHWLKQPAKGRALIETPSGSDDLSFFNLIEAHILRVATERDVPLNRLRRVVETIRERLPQSAHPLLDMNGLFSAHRIGLRSLYATTLAGQVEDLGHGGQLVFARLIRQYLSRIDVDASGPFRLRPFNFQHVALDHRLSGGRPVVLNTGILVEIIARRHRGGETIDELARDYHISRADVREAIRYAA